MPQINKDKTVPLQGDKPFKVPYEFSVKSGSSRYTTDLTCISRQVDIYKTGDERSLLVDACIDLILDTKHQLERTTEEDFFNHESCIDFPVIPFDECTLRCTTSTRGNEKVVVNIKFCAFSVPFPVSGYTV